MPKSSDASLGKIAVDKGFLSQEQLTECQTAASSHRGDRPPGDLLDVALEKGYLTHYQASQLRRGLEELSRRKDPVPGYKLVSELGRGGMGQVYRAIQVSLDRPVAIKVLPSRLAKNPAFIERFHREAISAAKLQHPNVVQVIEAGQTDDGLHFFVMEFVEGESVQSMLNARGRIEEKTALGIVRQLADALAAAQRLKLIHRDIKPANILVTREGQAKLADFGLARETSDNSMTQTGVMMGTPNYMSPEQVRGLKDLDTRTDIYSLGATFYHMVTGQLPFTGQTPTEIVLKHVEEPLRPPQQVVPGLSDGVNQVILRMMEKDRARRYDTPDQVIDDLGRVEAGQSLPPLPTLPAMGAGISEKTLDEATSPGVPPSAGPSPSPLAPTEAVAAPAPRASRRQQFLAAAAGFLFVLLLGAAALALLRPGTDPSRPLSPSENSSTSVQPTETPTSVPGEASTSTPSRATEPQAPDTPPEEEPARDEDTAPVRQALRDLRSLIAKQPKDYPAIFAQIQSIQERIRSGETVSPKLRREVKLLEGEEHAAFGREAQTQFDKACQSAQWAAQAGEYARALAALDAFPARLRTQGYETKLNEERLRLEEKAKRQVETISQQFTQAIADGNVDAAKLALAALDRAGTPASTDSARLKRAELDAWIEERKRMADLISRVSEARQARDYEKARTAVASARTALSHASHRERATALDTDLDIAARTLGQALQAVLRQIQKDGFVRGRIKGVGNLYIFQFDRQGVRYAVTKDSDKSLAIGFQDLSPGDITAVMRGPGGRPSTLAVASAVIGDYDWAYALVTKEVDAAESARLRSRIREWALLEADWLAAKGSAKEVRRLLESLAKLCPEETEFSRRLTDIDAKTAPDTPPTSDPVTLKRLFAGRIEKTPSRDGIIQVSYDFRDDSQIKDWVASAFFAMPGGQDRSAETADPSRTCWVQDGALHLSPRSMLGYRARFRGEMRLEMDMGLTPAIEVFLAARSTRGLGLLRAGWRPMGDRTTVHVVADRDPLIEDTVTFPGAATKLSLSIELKERKLSVQMKPGIKGQRTVAIPANMTDEGYVVVMYPGMPRLGGARRGDGAAADSRGGQPPLRIDRVTVSGRLDEEWLKSEMSVLSSPR